MRICYLLRHAKSSWGDSDLSDHARPLNKRGRRAAVRLGDRLVEEGLAFDLVLCSDARRAEETLSLLFEKAGFKGQVEMSSELYLADPPTLFAQMKQIDDRQHRVLFIGHNPGLEEVASRVAGEMVEMPTATLVELRFAVPSWSEVEPGSGELGRVWRAREFDE
jgi:phosphohistidine phosphatase